MGGKKLDQRLKEVHEIIKKRNIPVYKDIEKANDEITRFLNLIGETK